MRSEETSEKRSAVGEGGVWFISLLPVAEARDASPTHSPTVVNIPVVYMSIRTQAVRKRKAWICIYLLEHMSFREFLRPSPLVCRSLPNTQPYTLYRGN